jgi:putative flavoprotein involved in K+ transport
VRTEAVVVGAGHAGLAMSHCLAARGVDHVVLERGAVGERWRTSRWDGFRLLTPNWMSRLPGWAYAGREPDGFMTGGEFAEHLYGYVRSFNGPIRGRTPVTLVHQTATGFRVHTDQDVWTARTVIIATGYHSRARVPHLAAGLSPGTAQVSAARYRSPSGLADGGVLVVGASASGVQIAYELALAGRRVMLAVGGHTRLPRRYRDRDILWWLDRTGALERDIAQMPDAAAARTEPSLQLVGTSDARGVDLGVLQAVGVRLTGRLRALDDTVAGFADDLADTMVAAQDRLTRVLGEIDRYADITPDTAAGPPDPPPVIGVPSTPSTVDLRRAGISTVIWATGFRPAYPWLAVPRALDRHGLIRHRRGVSVVPGLYAIGLRFQSRRNSTFIDGARHDAAYLTDCIADHALCRAG